MFLLILKFAGFTFAGVLFEIFFNRIPKLRDRCKAYNIPFSFKGYIKTDWLSFVQQGVFTAVFLSLAVVLMRKYSINIEAMYVVCLAGGAYGTNILSKRFSAFGEYILHIVDMKTNISDTLTTNIMKFDKEKEPEEPPVEEPGGDRPESPINPLR